LGAGYEIIEEGLNGRKRGLEALLPAGRQMSTIA
jgi:hypothetical protein